MRQSKMQQAITWDHLDFFRQGLCHTKANFSLFSQFFDKDLELGWTRTHVTRIGAP